MDLILSDWCQILFKWRLILRNEFLHLHNLIRKYKPLRLNGFFALINFLLNIYVQLFSQLNWINNLLLYILNLFHVILINLHHFISQPLNILFAAGNLILLRLKSCLQKIHFLIQSLLSFSKWVLRTIITGVQSSFNRPYPIVKSFT